MSHFLRDLLPRDTDPDVAAYKEARAAGKSWSVKILKHPATERFDLVKAAGKLGVDIVDGRTVVFDDPNEIDVLTDFFLHEFRIDRQTPVEACTFAPGELAPLEAQIHQAHLDSRTSLFEVVATHDHKPQLLLRDRLTADAPELWLTDFGLSQSFHRIGPAFVFTRVVCACDLHMTGGFGFVFNPRHESALIEGYRRAMWSGSAATRSTRRMRFFFGLSRKIGQQVALEDVETGKR
ncbi:MAG TPA: hypothetical protein VGA56_02025 [Opitutaceae bacterium]